MFNVGCSSDIAFARTMGTEKTAHQVGIVKRRILSQYPDWKETFSSLNDSQPMREVSYEETGSEESSEAPTSLPEPPDNQEIEVIVLEERITQEESAPPPPSPPSESTNIVIAYPLQVILECPHCHLKWVGQAPEGYADHLATHNEATHSWMFLCALCAAHTDNDQDILHHLVSDLPF